MLAWSPYNVALMNLQLRILSRTEVAAYLLSSKIDLGETGVALVGLRVQMG